MAKVTQKELLDAGVHFGHLKRKWHPKMAPYIFMERNGIHIIDLNTTQARLDVATKAIKQIAKSGKKILFVATKKQAKNAVAERVRTVNMPFVTERWPGGMLTNFATIRRSIRKLSSIEKMKTDGTYENISKRERLQFERQKDKLMKNLGSISDLTRLPAALFIVDIIREHIAVAEARKLNIPTFAIVDTNSDPTVVDFPIPANDDAAKSISIIIDQIINAIGEGLEERKKLKEKEVKIAEKEAADSKDDDDSDGQEASAEAQQKDPESDTRDADDALPAKTKKGTRKRTTAGKKKAVKVDEE